MIADSNKVYISEDMVAKEQILEKYSVLIAMSSGSKEHVGKNAIVYHLQHKTTFGAFCAKFTPYGKYKAFSYGVLKSQVFQNYIQTTCSGTGINNLTNEHFNTPLFALPDKDTLLVAYNELVDKCYSKIALGTQKLHELQNLRDWLLPMLMNGQVTVE